MNDFYPQKPKRNIISIILGTLLFTGILFNGFVTPQLHINSLFSSIIFGCIVTAFYLHSGYVKLRGAQAQGIQRRWYQQPAILVGLSMLYGVIVVIFDLITTGGNQPNTPVNNLISIVIFFPTLLLLAFAACFAWWPGRKREGKQ